MREPLLPLEKQEDYRHRYAEMHPGWRPSTHVYQKRVAAHLGPRARVLDLGCGRGGVMERLYPSAGTAVGLDSDWSSLREHRMHTFPLSCGVACALPYPSDSFDVVCCSWVLEHLADPAGALAEVRRVLAPGGRFVFVTPNALHPLLGLNRFLQATGGRLVTRLYGREESDTFRSYYRANSVFSLRRIGSLVGMKVNVLQYVGDPTYLGFTESAFRVACLVEGLIPPALRVHIVGECVAV